MRGKWLRIGCIAGVLALVATACGDDDDDDTATDEGTEQTTETTAAETTAGGGTETTAGSGTETSGGAGGAEGETGAPQEIKDLAAQDPLAGAEASGLTRGVTDDSITIGCIVTARNYAGAEDGYKARFERANAEGGIHGRMIELTACEDDNLDDTQNLSVAQRLVEQDEVFAIVGVSANFNVPTTDYINENEVPLVAWAINPGLCGTRWGFGFNGCLIGTALPDAVPHAVGQGNLVDAIIQAAGLEASEVRFAAQAGDDDAGRAGNQQYQALFESRGAEVVYAEATIPVPGPTTNYTPFVEAVLEADPNIVYTSTAFQDVGGFSAALTAAGYEGVNMNFVAYVPGLLDAQAQLADALEGTYVNTQIVPQEEQTEYIKQVEEDLTAVEAEAGSFILFGAALAYAQADVLVQMLEAAGEDLNTTSFDEAVNGGGFTYESTAAGGPGSISFPEGHFLPADCSAILRVENKAYTSVVPFKCYPSVVL
jgi:ABC-type branched-subunit amino acid transport system substrate-binding protein